jgi:serine/threonine-protein kinase
MSDELPSGTVIAERYRIDDLLGEGGMGKVYSAEHVRIRKRVAIKVLHPEMSTMPEYVARFEREAVAAATISHPNVAAALDFGRLDDGSFYIVLEYVAGTDLRSILKSGPLPKERALRIIRQTIAAVGAAHAAGIVHRDLKPENIMVADLGGVPDSVKVLDFGIAKVDSIGIGQSSGAGGSSPEPLTKLGTVFGTPDYMSPEQAVGQTVDARADLYAIGVIFRELLTGKRLFQGGAVTLMRAHVLDAVPPMPPSVSRSIGPRLEAVIDRLLQKNPDARYASAAELLAALDEPETEDALDRSPPATTAATLRASQIAKVEGPPPSLRRSRASGAAAEPTPRASGQAAPRSSWDDEELRLPLKGRRSSGIWVVAILAIGGAGLYYFGFKPTTLEKSLLQDVPQASAALSAAESAIGSAWTDLRPPDADGALPDAPAAPSTSVSPPPTPAPRPASSRPATRPTVVPPHKPSKTPSSPGR